MRQVLKLHPECRSDAVSRVEVQVVRSSAGVLLFDYAVTAELSSVSLPPAAASARAGELWRHTCFEAFVQKAGDAAYYEFNFAPSTQWAAYHFDRYREGMMPAAEIAAPRFETERTPQTYNLRAALTLPCEGALRLGLSAVIEETNGGRSYWALAHAPGKPDFHHSDCFALELPAA